MKKFNRIIRVVTILLVFSLIGSACYVYFLSPKIIRITNTTFETDKVDSQLNGFKIAYLSDFNLNSDEDLNYFKNVINKLNQTKYDMMVIGGDLFESKVFKSSEIATQLNKVKCSYGKFATLGDKDLEYTKELKSLYTDAGIELINNTSRTIYYKNSSFELVACSQGKNASSIDHNSDKLVVSLNHQPDTFLHNASSCDLQLSGHSLGGSLYLPYIGSLFKEEGAKTYYHGKYTKDKATLIVSNGIKGTSSFKYKLLATNEIKIITLSKKASN